MKGPGLRGVDRQCRDANRLNASAGFWNIINLRYGYVSRDGWRLCILTLLNFGYCCACSGLDWVTGWGGVWCGDNVVVVIIVV